MNVIGIGGYLGHDSSAALIVDGKIVAAVQEERFTRNKHEKEVPHQSIQFCLQQGQLNASQITNVVFTEQPYTVQAFNRGGALMSRIGEIGDQILPLAYASGFHREVLNYFPQAKVTAVEHHLTHLSASYLLSGYDKAAFLCIDGKGENYSATIGRISGNECEILEKHRYENGLGMFYSAVTHFLGFLSFGDEYKVMGLAPYGKPRYVDELSKLFSTNSHGQFQMKTSHSWQALDANRELESVLGFPMRMPSDRINEKHQNVAASLQKIFEAEVFKLAAYAKKLCTGERQLIFTGGCAQNCVAAGRLTTAGIFNEVYTSPVASDMSSALGAAVFGSETAGVEVEVESFRSLYLGPEPGRIPAAATECQLEVEGELHAFVAKKISQGLSVAWVRGGMELGPRALGARSILADPRDSDAQSRLNQKIKFRESFRPFAPAILADRVGEWFKFSGRADYMNLTAELRDEHQGKHLTIPSVVHVDHSARLQTVHPEVHSDFYQLIKEFDALTGVPILINTSFNLAGEPIVCSAQDAWNTLLQCDIDLLVVGDEVFQNPRVETECLGN